MKWLVLYRNDGITSGGIPCPDWGTALEVAESIVLRHPDVWIRGPRGGEYRITGKRIRQILKAAHEAAQPNGLLNTKG